MVREAKLDMASGRHGEEAPVYQTADWAALAAQIKVWGRDLGFRQVGIAATALGETESRLLDWLAAGCHGDMDYLARHGTRRTRPAELVPGTLRILSARMDYRSSEGRDAETVLADPELGYVARYALGRDYHKVLRRRLQVLARRIAEAVGPFRHRLFVDSAPVMEVELAARAGLGWRGKNTLLLNRDGGSLFFLGEIYTDLPLPVEPPERDHCGTCRKCLDICPTAAFLGPYRLDARRCVSYLTIEHRGSIPLELRPLLGNRIYGCDDCQWVCPWNRFARLPGIADFAPRNGLDGAKLVDLFAWSEAEFLARLQGSPIRRIGHERWLRNLAVALGNAPTSPAIIAALRARREHPSPLVREHVLWALQRHGAEPEGADSSGVKITP